MARLTVGLRSELRVEVTEDLTAGRLGHPQGIDLLGTPAMVALMEYVADAITEDRLPPGYVQVGTRVELDHLAPTPLGQVVTVLGEIVEVRGRDLTFHIEAHNDVGRVCQGRLYRKVVFWQRFDRRMRARFGGGQG
jgi:predicted thioesterase